MSFEIKKRDGRPYELQATEFGKEHPTGILFKQIREVAPINGGARVITPTSEYYFDCDYAKVFSAWNEYREVKA